MSCEWSRRAPWWLQADCRSPATRDHVPEAMWPAVLRGLLFSLHLTHQPASSLLGLTAYAQCLQGMLSTRAGMPGCLASLSLLLLLWEGHFSLGPMASGCLATLTPHHSSYVKGRRHFKGDFDQLPSSGLRKQGMFSNPDFPGNQDVWLLFLFHLSGNQVWGPPKGVFTEGQAHLRSIGLSEVKSLTTRCMSELGLRVNDAPQEQRNPCPGPPASLSPSTRCNAVTTASRQSKFLSHAPSGIVVIVNLKGWTWE